MNRASNRSRVDNVSRESSCALIFLIKSYICQSFTLAAIRSPGYIELATAEDERKWIHGDISKRIKPEREALIKKVLQDLDADLTDPKLRALLQVMPVVERKKKYGYHRHCSACNLYKPDRTHHCRVCDRCILRMDHHCPWIANCVGFGNYKFFLLLLFYGILSTLFVMGSMARRLAHAFRPILSQVDFMLEDLPVAIIFILCLFLSIALSMFFAFHMNLTVNSMTTIELREKKNNDDPFIKHRFEVAHIKFDKGPWRNFINVFGPWYIWLLPIHAGGDGTYSTVDGNLVSLDVDKGKIDTTAAGTNNEQKNTSYT